MRSIHMLLPLLLAFAAPAIGADGVNEINQTCAVSTGCFIGDSAGFPITIGSGPTRSYRLTGDLVVPDENTTAIVVVASGVTLDLGGFEIRGPNLCTKPAAGGPLFCTFSGGGVGIRVTGERTEISNGSIVGMGDDGLNLQAAPGSGSGGHVLHDLRVAHNGYNGIRVQNVSAVDIVDVRVLTNANDGIWVTGDRAVTARHVKAVSNGRDGIHLTATGCLVIDSTADENENYGISAELGGTVTGSTVSRNGDSGIFMANPFGSINAAYGLVSNNSAYGNRRHGIEAFGLISGNMIQSNLGDGISAGPGAMIQGNTVVRSALDGISIRSGGVIQGNAVRDNAGSGLNLGIAPTDPTLYRENTITAFTTITGFGVNGGANLCNGSLTCP